MSVLSVNETVARALAAGEPVVALESGLIAHGLPRPQNRRSAAAIEAAVRDEGATPATIAVIDGRLWIGCTAREIDRIATEAGVAKVSRRDLSRLMAFGGLGATTVSATMIGAARAGIRVLATGGIGGVHRGAEASFDISADLIELGRTPVAVICSGAKAILDLARTSEVLETQGVPVAGFGCDTLPAFYVRDSGLPLDCRVDTPDRAARLVAAQLALGLGGIVIANPIPPAAAIDQREMEAWLDTALTDARDSGIGGKQATPFLLERIAALSGGRTVAANIALIEENARLAARIAAALSKLDKDRGHGGG